MVKCKRCDVDLVRLAVIKAGFGDYPKDVDEEEFPKISLMLWGGEVRDYNIYECPKCGELTFIREKKDKK